jgi:D-xylose reductase
MAVKITKKLVKKVPKTQKNPMSSTQSSPETLKTVRLHSGATMPSVGLGLWKIDTTNTAQMVVSAIESGYRQLDGACDYGNEREAGLGVRQAIASGLCARESLWVTSKLWNTYHRPVHVRQAVERSLRDWGLDYFDLYLIHFPISLAYVPFERRYPPGWYFDPEDSQPQMVVDPIRISDTWEAMEQLVDSGLVRHIGVCNFNCSLMRDLLAYARIRPEVLQVESHPYLVQAKLLRYCQQEQIAFTAFSPLGAGSYVSLNMATSDQSVLNELRVSSIAQQHGKTPAQIVLRWAVQRGTSIIPKTSRPERLKENLAIFDFELSQQEMKQIGSLDRNQRFNDPGVFCEQAFHKFMPIYE